ncbi:glycerate kinase [Anaerobacillus alkalidiazotrophicus]|uniref:Glycerate kinase n=1 Tax=Anaerobacillus alkalidiazotrophicus TaxID=472963 RepID=A0A1S2M476_9BACI|nr:glycerate kinase [Anaerobacillus alkalidiazotrophicus]OIJ18103.1 glycerate kinase [Anaerobacillus alkalidiazotrophicus]OIJ19582.1 glycerate kinase [Anaerobacillus alkalidiazotrophicus]
MKVVIAPDSFKESLTALEVANAIEEGLSELLPNANYVKIPMADGGEGTVQSLVDATGGFIEKVSVIGPLGNKVEAFYGLLGDGKTAAIEMASASGIHLVPFEKRNPMNTTTWGTGELIIEALDKGVEKIIIGIGGSATNDGGAGMVQALGGKLLDNEGKQIPLGGAGLEKLARIDVSTLDPRLKEVTIEVACDVDNPLTGPKGASAIYGPQKGATPEQIELLDENLAIYARIIERDLGKSIEHVPGAGAAGGLGAGLLAFLSSELKRGGDLVIEATRLEEEVRDADLVITGEGGINHQTIHGKTPTCVALTAKKHGVPVIAIAGSLTNDYKNVYDYGIDALFSVVPGIVSLEEALEKGYENVKNTARNIVAVIKFFIKE